MKKILVCALAFTTMLGACKKKTDDTKNTTTPPAGPNLVFKVYMDSTQPRLNSFGQITPVPSGHAAQSPVFNSFSLHYIEFAPNALTALGAGKILYYGPETTKGGANAIDFDQAKIVKNGEVFLSVPLKNLAPGTYQWARVSILYQNYNIKYRYNSINGVGTLASFLGFNTYISSYKINTLSKTLSANKLQGYWGFESFGTTVEGQAPATTVPNPISSTSPVPAGSCVVTGKFPTDLVITGNETEDIVIDLKFGTNQSFEWDDSNSPDGIYDPSQGDVPTDMGTRGLIPSVE